MVVIYMIRQHVIKALFTFMRAFPILSRPWLGRGFGVEDRLLLLPPALAIPILGNNAHR